MSLNPDISVNLDRLKLKNPVMTASGTFGYGKEFDDVIDLNQLGAIVVKGISLKPMIGNPPPRVVETPGGMLNAIGLANIGIDSFLKDKLPWLTTLNTEVIVNIYGHSINEYGELASALRGVKGVSALEVNISCPNVDKGGLVFGKDPDVSGRVTETVVKNTDKPVIVKLTPNVSDITILAKAVEQAGAHALSVINTLTGMAVDINTRRPRLGNVSGGLSGPAIKPVALYMVYQTARAVRIPVIGIGGILNASDALEFMIAGASAVQVGTANFINPRATIEIIEGIRNYCLLQGIGKISDIVGSLITARQV
jgi:dihydroorotate dehydrogenase (NAD+) catalytic subunit